jgi:hypothetical protein
MSNQPPKGKGQELRNREGIGGNDYINDTQAFTYSQSTDYIRRGMGSTRPYAHEESLMYKLANMNWESSANQGSHQEPIERYPTSTSQESLQFPPYSEQQRIIQQDQQVLHQEAYYNNLSFLSNHQQIDQSNFQQIQDVRTPQDIRQVTKRFQADQLQQLSSYLNIAVSELNQRGEGNIQELWQCHIASLQIDAFLKKHNLLLGQELSEKEHSEFLLAWKTITEDGVLKTAISDLQAIKKQKVNEKENQITEVKLSAEGLKLSIISLTSEIGTLCKQADINRKKWQTIDISHDIAAIEASQNSILFPKEEAKKHKIYEKERYRLYSIQNANSARAKQHTLQGYRGKLQRIQDTQRTLLTEIKTLQEELTSYSTITQFLETISSSHPDLHENQQLSTDNIAIIDKGKKQEENRNLEQNSLLNKVYLFDDAVLQNARKFAVENRNRNKGMELFKDSYTNWDRIVTAIGNLQDMRSGKWNGDDDDNTIIHEMKEINDIIDSLGTKSIKIFKIRHEMKKHIDESFWPQIGIKGNRNLEQNSLLNKVYLFDDAVLQNAKNYAITERSKNKGMELFKDSYTNWDRIVTAIGNLQDMRSKKWNGGDDNNTIIHEMKEINDTIDSLGIKNVKIFKIRHEMKKHIDESFWPQIGIE